MKAMILAAGYGTRFRPATYELPKPLIPLCNLPLIGYSMETLLDAGVTDVVVNLHHLPERLRDWLEKNYSSRCRLSFSFEPTILGTGGGVRKVRRELEGEEDFFLLNGDTVQIPPLERMREARRSTDALATLALRRPPDNDRYTAVFFDGTFVTGFGKGNGESMMFSGSHVLSRRIFEALPDRDFSGITEDVYFRAVASGDEKIAGVVDDGLWFDIGTPRRYLEATQTLRDLMVRRSFRLTPGSTIANDSVVDSSAVVEGSVVRSTIGPDTAVHASSWIEDSSLWRGAHISADSSVLRSVIGEGVDLPRGSQLDNVLVCRRLESVTYPPEIVMNGDFVARKIDDDSPSRFEIGE